VDDLEEKEMTRSPLPTVITAHVKRIAVERRKKVLEKEIERKVCKYAVGQGALVFKFTPSGQAGWPDRLFAYDGHICFVEFKAPRRYMTQLQHARAAVLRAAGFSVVLINDVDEGCKWLDMELFRHRRLRSVK
jgi:hypothetical protein